MVFYPDNDKRASRLQQLVDSMANMQTDVKNIADQMDAKNTQYRPAIDGLLKANGMNTIDDLINKVAAQMTPDERTAFEALIQTVKNSKADFNITYFVAGILMVPEGIVLSGKMAIAIARWGSRIVNVAALAGFFKAAEGGTAAAAAAAGEVAAEAEEAEKTLQVGSEAGEEVGEAATLLGRIGTFFKVLGAVGLVISVIAAVIELVQGAEQKEKLIEGIHGLQPARLTTAFFKQEGQNIMQQLETLKMYLDASPGGPKANPQMAAFVASELIDAITKENADIDLNKIESDLEAQDRTSSLFYGDDDLSHDQVVATASQTQ